MILFLLKIRRLPVQLIVGLLLVLGTIPQQSQGLQCYECFKEKIPGNTCNKTPVTCEPGVTYCRIMIFDDGQPIERYCESYGEKLLKCMVDLGYAKIGSSCGHLRDTKSGDYPQEIWDCVDDGQERSSSLKWQNDDLRVGKIDCVCQTDLCNTVENIKLLDMPTTTTPSLPQNSQPQLASSKILTYAILTSIAFSNYF